MGNLAMIQEQMTNVKETTPMKHVPLAPFSISLPPRVKDTLRKMAAERNVKQPETVESAAGLARQILCEYLDGTAQDVTESGLSPQGPSNPSPLFKESNE
jgi:hypothetical protein